MYYRLIKRMIEMNNYISKADMTKKIDVFWLTGKLTDEEHDELLAMLDEAEKH